MLVVRRCALLATVLIGAAMLASSLAGIAGMSDDLRMASAPAANESRVASSAEHGGDCERNRSSDRT